MDKKGEETKGGFSDLADKGVAIGAAVVAGTGVAIGGLMAMANSTSETAAKWLELSQRTDIGVESLQKWGYAAEMSGADIGKLEVGMKKLSDTMIDAQNGGKASQAAYEKLGISMQQLSTMTPEQAFERVMYSLADMEDGALKNSVGNDLLGKSFTELKPLLAEGSSGMQDLKAKAEEMGIVMSEDSVVAAEGFGDELDNVKKGFEGVKNKLALELIPKLTELLKWVQDKMPAIQEFASKAFDKISGAIQFVSDNSSWLIPILSILLGAFMAFQVLSGITAIIGVFNAVMALNPAVLITLAIIPLIAILVALALNFDKVSEFAVKLWEKIKETFGGIKDSIVKTFDNIKDAVFEKFGAIWEKIKEIAGKIKDAFTGLFDGFKLPHIKITKGSMNPLKWFDEGLPKIGIDWYAKGGIFDKPTIFNTPYGLKGVGDAKSPEVVAPLHELRNMLGLDDKKEPQQIQLNLNIENFNNNTESDLEEIADKLLYVVDEKIKRRGLSLA